MGRDRIGPVQDLIWSYARVRPSWMLDLMTRALLVIDVQESFRQGPLWPAISNPGIAGDVARLVDGARANGDLELY